MLILVGNHQAFEHLLTSRQLFAFNISTTVSPQLPHTSRTCLDIIAVPLAAFLGFVVPPLLGYCWGDAMGGFIYGGLVTRLASKRKAMEADKD